MAAHLTPLAMSRAEALSLPNHTARRVEQLAVGAAELRLAKLGLGARRPRNFNPPQFDAAAAVAQPGADIAGNLGDLLHGADQHAYAVAEQAGVGRIVDVGLYHRGIDAHLAPLDHALVLGDRHHALVDLRDRLRRQRRAPATHRLGIRHFAAAHPGEVAVDQIGAHLPFQGFIAPVADVLERQQAQNHLGRSAAATTAAAVGMTFHQRLVDRCHQRFIRQHRVGMRHPGLAQIADFRGDQAVAEAQLGPPHLNHGACSAGCDAVRCPRPAGAVHD